MKCGVRCLPSLRLRELNEAVEVASPPFVLVDDALINHTIQRAKTAPRKRARVLLHPDPSDSLHEMVIALPRESCDVPHINFKSGKSFNVLRGEMAVMLFSQDGREVVPVRLGATGAKSDRMVRLTSPHWHTIIPLSDHVVFLETISGPFVGNQFAAWAPKVDSDKWSAFVASLRSIALAGHPAPLFDIGLRD